MDNFFYKITFFSKVELPDYKGLVNETLEFHFEEKKREEGFLGMDIDVFFVFTEVMGKGRCIVLKSQSQFDIKLNSTFTTDDAYGMIKHSIFSLKGFKGEGYTSIENELGRIPILTKEEVLSDVKNITQWYESRRSK